jgi:23S rRNA pseudouridine1911/1915/1917 synthase
MISEEEGKRLDVYLSEKLFLTRTKVKHMLEKGHVRVDGKVAKPSMKVKPRMKVEGEIPEEEPINLTPQAIPLTILYEDQYILAVNKPPGMVVHPSFGHREGTLVNAVLAYLQVEQSAISNQQSAISNPQSAIVDLRPGIVHRLDKGTSGVILVAKDGRTQELLSALFKERSVEKTYRAIVEGSVAAGTGTIEGNIGRHPTDRKRMAVRAKGGRPSLTSFRVLERLSGFTCVEAYPKTGRTHQIRVHFASIGHPVAGDETYGRKARQAAPRPLLHAHRISFAHPVTGQRVLIEAPVPEDMDEFMKRHRNL